MTEPTLSYRLWQCGAQWHWQVMSDLKHVLVSGVAESSVAARSAAFRYCLEHPDNLAEAY
jgi:hypothetical protein